MAGLRVDRTKLDSILDSILTQVVDELADICQEEIKSDQWEWAGITRRKNGETVGSPRNIVDTGELLDSLKILKSGNSALIYWDAPHAAIVHEGYVSDSGYLYVGRPWTDTGIARFKRSGIK